MPNAIVTRQLENGLVEPLQHDFGAELNDLIGGQVEEALGAFGLVMEGV
jgi:hypothetical protein